jgi:hypothetical protein
VVAIAYKGCRAGLSEIGQAAHFADQMRGYAITVDLGERGCSLSSTLTRRTQKPT